MIPQLVRWSPSHQSLKPGWFLGLFCPVEYGRNYVEELQAWAARTTAPSTLAFLQHRGHVAKSEGSHEENVLSCPHHPSCLSCRPKLWNGLSLDQLGLLSPVQNVYPWNLEQRRDCFKSLSSGVDSYIASSLWWNSYHFVTGPCWWPPQNRKNWHSWQHLTRVFFVSYFLSPTFFFFSRIFSFVFSWLNKGLTSKRSWQYLRDFMG